MLFTDEKLAHWRWLLTYAYIEGTFSWCPYSEGGYCWLIHIGLLIQITCLLWAWIIRYLPVEYIDPLCRCLLTMHILLVRFGNIRCGNITFTNYQELLNSNGSTIHNLRSLSNACLWLIYKILSVTSKRMILKQY